MYKGISKTVRGGSDPYPQTHVLTIEGSVDAFTPKVEYLNEAKSVLQILHKLPSGTWLRVLRGMLETEMGHDHSLTSAFDIVNRRIHDDVK